MLQILWTLGYTLLDAKEPEYIHYLLRLLGDVFMSSSCQLGGGPVYKVMMYHGPNLNLLPKTSCYYPPCGTYHETMMYGLEY